MIWREIKDFVNSLPEEELANDVYVSTDDNPRLLIAIGISSRSLPTTDEELVGSEDVQVHCIDVV